MEWAWLSCRLPERFAREQFFQRGIRGWRIVENTHERLVLVRVQNEQQLVEIGFNRMVATASHKSSLFINHVSPLMPALRLAHIHRAVGLFQRLACLGVD